MANAELQKYINDLKAKNVPSETIKSQLVSSGWSSTDVDQAFNEASSPTLSTLPPPPVPHFSMWITFEYLILFISMYVSFTALGGILHFAVDRIFPQPVSDSYSTYQYISSYLLTGYMASIIITFPVFFGLFLHLNRMLEKTPAIRNIRSRKILIYITLVITFIYMITQLIMTVYSFFQGNSTTSTFMHLLVNLLVAGSVFIYLIYGIRGDRQNNA